MEVIREINGVEYIISDKGKIYSTKNIGRGKYGKELKQRLDASGYPIVTVGKNFNRRVKRVHRIIAETFIPNPENLSEVDHLNRDRANNDATNLCWISSFDNKSQIPFEVRSESHKHENNGRAKLSINEVNYIRELYKSGVSIAEIARMYERGYSTIFNIVKYKTWR